MFNGLMQIPGREHRRAALRELHRVCAPGAPLLFTTHDRDSTPTERALWRLETIRARAASRTLVSWNSAIATSRKPAPAAPSCIFPVAREIITDSASTGCMHEFDAMRSTVAKESRAVRDFSDECRFWVARKK